MGVAVDPNTLQFELWTLPSSGDHKLVGVLEHVLPGATGTRELSAWADEKVPVPATEKLLTNWAGGWIRVKLGGQYIDEFLAERLVQPLGRPAVIEISGPQRNGIVEKCAVYPYNWPNHAEDAPNWNWGSERNLIRNGGAEENPHGLPNAGFEDGTPDPWQAGAGDGTSATLSVVTDDPDDGTYHAKVTALLNEGGMSTQVNVYPGRLYTFTINGKSGSSGSHDWQLGASGEGVSSAPGAYMPPDGREEALKDHTFDDSAYDEVWMQFVSGPKQTSAQLNVRYIGADPSKILYVDQVEWSGFGVGCDGWEVTNGVADFQVAQDITPSEGSYHFRAVAGQHHGPFQSIRGLAPGGTYSYRLDVAGPAAGHIWTVQIQDVRGRRIHQKTVTLTTSMAEATGTFTVPTDLPGDGTLRFWLVNRHQGQSTLYFDDVRLFEGLPAATATEIIKKVLDAAQTRGTFTFLELDATDAADTSGTALSAITFTIPWSAGVTLGTVLGGLRQQGYEWRIIEAEHAEVITPQATTTHVLQMWAPGGGPEDHTTDPAGPVILTGAKTPGGSVARRIPPFTSVLVHGEGVTIEDTNAAAEATYGRWETSVDAEAVNSEATAQAVADAVFAEEQANREALSVDVLATDQHVPLIHFSEGDLVKWHLPGYVDPVAKRVRRVTWQNSTPARFGVQGSRILTAEAALAVAVRDLLLEPKRRRGSGSGGRPIVAPTEVTESFGAHIHLLGGSQTVDAEAIDWDALLASPLATAIPAFPTSEVTIRTGGYYPFYVHIEFDDWFQGGDIWITRTRGGDTSQVWPPSGASDLWSSPGGSRFTDIAPAIDCEPGDVYRLWVDCGGEVTVKRAVFVPWLADRKPNSVAPPQDILVFTESTTHDFGAGGLFDMYLFAGGGGGGWTAAPAGAAATGGGGGAGGLIVASSVWVAGSQSITIGAGGAAAVDASTPATDGGDSVFLSYTAVGGGRGGGGGTLAEPGGDGGCGGGGGSTVGSGIPGQGYAGGARATTAVTWVALGGSGGGVAGPGNDGFRVKAGDADTVQGGAGLDLSSLVGTGYGNNGVFGEGGDAGRAAVGESTKHAPTNSGSGGRGTGLTHGPGNGADGILILVPKG